MNLYYVLERENNDAYPLFSSNEERGTQIACGEVVNVMEGPVALRVGSPVPQAPQFVDYHVMPEPVVSKRLYEVLDPLHLHRVQLVPAVVTHNKQELPYWVVNVCNRLPAVDMAKSRYTRDASGDIGILEKLVLDPAKLDAVPNDQKLMFVPTEYESIWLVHESVKNVMEQAKPQGVRFFSLDEWDDAAAFR
jgi:hypothetical protein